MENFSNQIENIVSSLGTFNKIIILGKGNSINLIDKLAFENAFVININDSEKIYSGNLAVFHSDWVIDSLIESGFKAKYYLTDEDLAPTIQIDKNRVLFAKYKPESFESFEKLTAKFTGEELYISDFLILTALKASYFIAKYLKRKLEVYMVGFDFQIAENAIINDLSGHSSDFKQVFLNTQKNYLSIVKDYINQNLELDVIHVGNIELSDISIDEFNSIGVNNRKIEADTFDNNLAYSALVKRCKDEGYTAIVAEFTNNHVGNADRLRKMVSLAKKSGADMIKVQKRDVDSFYTEDELKTPYKSPFGNTLKDYRQGVELDQELFEILIAECQKHRIVWFASVLDYASFQIIQQYNPPLIKLPSTISNHRNYLSKVAEEFKGDLVISTGFTDVDYEKFILKTFLNGRNVFLLQCTSSYPAPPEACQIAVVRHYDELSFVLDKPQLLSGYSSHDLGSIGCMMSVAAGAKMIEKHVKLGNLDWVHFDGVALDLLGNDFTEFVADVRKAQVMSGSKQKKIHSQEHHKYRVNEKHN